MVTTCAPATGAKVTGTVALKASDGITEFV